MFARSNFWYGFGRYVNSVSYNHFLVDRVGLEEETLPILNAHLRILSGPSGWNHTVFEAITEGAPGLRAMASMEKERLSFRHTSTLVPA